MGQAKGWPLREATVPVCAYVHNKQLMQCQQHNIDKMQNMLSDEAQTKVTLQANLALSQLTTMQTLAASSCPTWL